MKKLIVVIAIAGFISLGFTLVNTPQEKIISKGQNSEKIDVSHKSNEKELASWD